MAVLAHVLQLLGGWIAPLVIFFLKRQSRFVSFHALQVLLFQALCLFLEMFAIAGIFVATSFGLMSGSFPAQHGSSAPPPVVFLLFALLMLGFLVLWILKLVLAVVYGIKAGRGEWAEYPILGRFARQILHIGPGGAAYDS